MKQGARARCVGARAVHVTTIEADEAAASTDFLKKKTKQTKTKTKTKREREREKERKRAEDNISISALLKVIFGM